MDKRVFLINSLKFGGAERVVSNFLNFYVKKYKCFLILIENDKIEYELDSRIVILNLNQKKNRNGLIKTFNLLFISYKLNKLIKKNKFGSVVSFLTRSNYINVISSLLSQHKTIICERSSPSLHYNLGLKGLFNKILIRLLYPYANVCIANSKGNAKDLLDNFKISNVISIPNPFDIDMINKLSNESIKVKKEKFTFISVGRLDKGKNHLLLIEAMKSVNAVLWIIGTGNEMGYLKKYINSKKLNEKVLLLNNKKNPFSYLSKADCFVFSSKHEGFPNVIVEALACKLPVISSDCRFGPREILSPQSDFSFELEKEIELAEFGILYPVNSLKKLIDSMTLIINNVSLRKKYKNISSKRADHFNLNKVIIDFDKVISN